MSDLNGNDPRTKFERAKAFVRRNKIAFTIGGLLKIAATVLLWQTLRKKDKTR